MGESNKDSGVIQVRQNASRNKGYFIYHGQTLLETDADGECGTRASDLANTTEIFAYPREQSGSGRGVTEMESIENTFAEQLAIKGLVSGQTPISR